MTAMNVFCTVSAAPLTRPMASLARGQCSVRCMIGQESMRAMNAFYIVYAASPSRAMAALALVLVFPSIHLRFARRGALAPAAGFRPSSGEHRSQASSSRGESRSSSYIPPPNAKPLPSPGYQPDILRQYPATRECYDKKVAPSSDKELVFSGPSSAAMLSEYQCQESTLFRIGTVFKALSKHPAGSIPSIRNAPSRPPFTPTESEITLFSAGCARSTRRVCSWHTGVRD